MFFLRRGTSLRKIKSYQRKLSPVNTSTARYANTAATIHLMIYALLLPESRLKLI